MIVMTAQAKLLIATLLVCVPTQLHAQESIPPTARYREVAASLEKLIEHEVKAQGLPAVSISLVADGKIVWSQGFGYQDPSKKTPATAETAYRVGSVSKLFTDLALMQLVDEGRIDLDAPVKNYLPTFEVKNTSDKPITLRQLMSHRAGITREPPVGHYFDPTGPTQKDTVASLNSTAIVYEPTTHTKYSNAGIAVVGEVVATLRKEAFEDTVKKTVLDRLGLEHSDFRLTPEVAKSLAKAQMWTYDGRTFEAPTFPLGTPAAGNLYSTVNDLGKFLVALLKDGDGIVKSETLKAMCKVQFVDGDKAGGFGLGFMVSSFEGCPRIGHSGAVYGFATDVQALPFANLGVAVVASKDCANGTVKRIAEDALRAMLAVKLGKPLPTVATTDPVDAELGRRVETLGFTNRADAPLRVSYRLGRLWDIKGSHDGVGMENELRRLGDQLLFDGPFAVDLDRRFSPVSHAEAKETNSPPMAENRLKPDDPPKSFDGLIGEYGWDHNVLYVYEEGGSLRVLIEWFFHYKLDSTDDPDRFKFGNIGLYLGERADFTRDQNGRATQVTIGDVVFKRRPIPGEDGKTFRIKPVRPVEELRAEALKAKPPIESGEFVDSDLLELAKLDPTLRFDIRYASDNNFLGTPFYSEAKAKMQKPAAEALVAANKSLAKHGLGLLIHDAYRPWYVTKMFWDATPEANHNFVADPKLGSKHNRGCAVDLTLYDLKTGEPIRMVGGYDEFSDRSNPFYPGGTSRQRWYRDTLRSAMESHGFRVNEFEWWHFDYKDWSTYRIGNE